METKLNTDLTSFRAETRIWLNENCPTSLREPIDDPSQLYWGGRNAKFFSKDQEIWFKKC